MKRVFENQEMVVLSNKELALNRGSLITFTDGSFVDVDTRVVTNKGTGEIVIRDLPMWPSMEDIIKKQQTLRHIKHLSVDGGMNNIVILPNENTECLISIGGADTFAQNCVVSQSGDELHVETPENKKNVYINRGSIWVNGKRLPPRFEDDFGYVEIQCNYLHSLCVNAFGSGEILSYVPIDMLKAKIKGATSIEASQLRNAELNISGSGNLVVDELYGCLYGRVSGSGNIDVLDGLIDYADVAISGSGDLTIGALVKTAKLSHSGSGDIMIAHILEEYTAQRTGSGLLRVLKTGIQ